MTIQELKHGFTTQTAKSTNAIEAADNAVKTAATQRRPFYACDEAGRTAFRKAYANELLTYLARYSTPVDGDDHCQNIQSIAETLTKEFSSSLVDSRLNIGTAQKALNLFLKTIWCLDPTFPSPPHCPIDRVVLEHSGILGNWTQLDDIAKYRYWISGMRHQVNEDGYDNLSEWELLGWPMWTFPKNALCAGTAAVMLEHGVGFTFDLRAARKD